MKRFIKNICTEALKTLLFIRVFEFHYCGRRRSRDGSCAGMADCAGLEDYTGVGEAGAYGPELWTCCVLNLLMVRRSSLSGLGG